MIEKKDLAKTQRRHFFQTAPKLRDDKSFLALRLGETCFLKQSTFGNPRSSSLPKAFGHPHLPFLSPYLLIFVGRCLWLGRAKSLLIFRMLQVVNNRYNRYNRSSRPEFEPSLWECREPCLLYLFMEKPFELTPSRFAYFGEFLVVRL